MVFSARPVVLCALVALSSVACAAEPERLGKLADPNINEASGLARSLVADDRYWVINDSGNAAVLYAIDRRGQRLGSIIPRGIGNVDWEDLDSFEHDGEAYLVIADIGDNNGVRAELRVHIVKEPANVPGRGRTAAIDVVRTLRLAYPDGGRDAESIAVYDNHLYIMTKRTLPPELYRVSLDNAEDGLIEMEFLGKVRSLPPPTVRELADAPRRDQFGWQPTAMSFSSTGDRAVVVTNWRAFVFSREPDQSWGDALNGSATVLPMPPVKRAESVCFDSPETGLITTFEGRHAPVFRLPLP
ncbi:MAG: hypothetical protein AAGC71_00605 [Pseudomonadota bacterium]